mmetsp:Transcript_71205/g.113194  ORF Transcript_71205/g.113194 Transcript_71205/m.113194 type:complete len:249 (+) Transcript_71205:55-801(+)
MITTYVEPLQDKPASGNHQNDQQYESKQEEDDYDDNEQHYNQYNDNDDEDEDEDDISPKKASYHNDNNNFNNADNNKAEANKTMTVEEFKSARLDVLFDDDDDYFDIGKKICHFFDDKFGDTDTVCLVAATDQSPAISYWVRGQYVRKDLDIGGKHIMVYRACKHVPPKEPVLTQAQFEKYVQELSEEYEKETVDTIGDMMDKKLGDGCHYARSTVQNNHYDVYARFKDQYDASFKIKSGSFIIAWRR